MYVYIYIYIYVSVCVQGGYLVAHHDSQAQYQQPVLMIQLRSDSALSFGHKAGGWSHVNEVHAYRYIPVGTLYLACHGAASTCLLRLSTYCKTACLQAIHRTPMSETLSRPDVCTWCCIPVHLSECICLQAKQLLF